MKAALEALLKLRDEGLLARFAIGGAIAASYYVEAVVTEDLHVFAFLTRSPSGLLVLGPLYERLAQLGGKAHNEHVVIGGWPMQIRRPTRRWLKRRCWKRKNGSLKGFAFLSFWPSICAPLPCRPAAPRTMRACMLFSRLVLWMAQPCID